MTTDVRTTGSDFTEVHTNTAAHFAKSGYIGIGIEDAFKGIVHSIDKAAGELSGYFLPALDMVGVAAVIYMLLIAQ